MGVGVAKFGEGWGEGEQEVEISPVGGRRALCSVQQARRVCVQSHRGEMGVEVEVEFGKADVGKGRKELTREIGWGVRIGSWGPPSNHSPFFHRGRRFNGHPRARNKGWDFVSVCLLVCFFPSPTMSTTHLLSRSWSSPKTHSERDWCLQPEQCVSDTDPGFPGTLHPLAQGFQHHQQPSLRGATRGSAGREGGRSAPLGEFCSARC